MERRLKAMIAVTVVLLGLFMFWDAFRPKRRDARTRDPVAATPPTANVPAAAQPAPDPAAVPPLVVEPQASTTSQGAEVPAAREPSYIEMLARSEMRRRIRASGSSTYLGDMLAASSDSMLRRWENRRSVPIRVWFAPTNAANFQPAFLDAIRDAFGRWTGLGVPVRFHFGADSTSAEVTVTWRIQFEIERSGQTDVTWDHNGQIQSALITLATFDPKGRPMAPDDIRVVATHEVGHVLGLDHSSDSTDIMYPTAKVRELSNRDARTVMLLYHLTPGSLR